MITYKCEDCLRLVDSETVYCYDLKNVCGRCYAIHSNHPSIRKVK
jgi:hypothetical protein